MNLIINLPDTEVAVLKAKASARGLSAEQYALRVLEEDLAPEWLRESWNSSRGSGAHLLSLEDIDAEIAAARSAKRGNNSRLAE